MSACCLFRRAVGAAVLLALAACASAADPPGSDGPRTPEAAASRITTADQTDVIRVIEFAGLRRISPGALRAHISSREGEILDPARIEEDVRALDRLGWFDSVSAEIYTIPILLADERIGTSDLPTSFASGGQASSDTGAVATTLLPNTTERLGLRLVFVLTERPFLAGVSFRGSRVLSRQRINAILAEKRITLKTAAPVNRTDLWHAARALEAALADAGHPRAQVRVYLEEVPTAAVRARFNIHDGPEVTVRRVSFAGNHAFSEDALRRQMKRVSPNAYFADLRGKTIYTPERLAEDLERLESFYRNHGYPEARLGQPSTYLGDERVRKVFPWPHRRTAPRFHISIPVEEGRFYRLGAVRVESEVASGEPVERKDELPALKANEPYSRQKIERVSEELTRLREFRATKIRSAPPEVDVTPEPDPSAGTVGVTFHVRPSNPYIVRRLEFVGERRFSDRYYRRRILVREDEPFDTRKLELGLAQLARSGYIRPVKPQDISLRLDESSHTADLIIRVQEMGRQKISLVGGHAGLGNTVGLVYNVFNLLGGEELITAHLEGGPESLQVLLGIAKEGLFGTKASLGFSLFQNVIRPNLPGSSRRQRLFTSRSSGLGLAWSYPVTPLDTVGVNYQRAHTSTQYDLSLPPSIAGLASNQLRASTRSRTIGLSESRDTGHERLSADVTVSGGWLGGDENLLRPSLEYARVLADPLSASHERRNSWGFRGYFAGVGSYRGELPLHSRLFGGEDLVRGTRDGELGAYAVTKSGDSNGSSAYRAQPAGADLVSAANSEYRVPLMRRTEAAAFFDAGSGWLLPRWLGSNRPTLLTGTNGILRASTGIETRWLIPGIEQTVRLHYAISPWRFGRSILLPDGTRFRPPHRLTALGWGLGTLI